MAATYANSLRGIRNRPTWKRREFLPGDGERPELQAKARGSRFGRLQPRTQSTTQTPFSLSSLLIQARNPSTPRIRFPAPLLSRSDTGIASSVSHAVGFPLEMANAVLVKPVAAVAPCRAVNGVHHQLQKSSSAFLPPLPARRASTYESIDAGIRLSRRF